jgi:hypothetical protein
MRDQITSANERAVAAAMPPGFERARVSVDITSENFPQVMTVVADMVRAGADFIAPPIEREISDRPATVQPRSRKRARLRSALRAAEKAGRIVTAPRTPVPDGVTRYVMARDLAGTVFPVSEDLILQQARKHVIGRKLGRAIIFSPDDIQHLYEVLPCYGSSAAASRPIGSFAAPSGASALKKAAQTPWQRSAARPHRRRKSHDAGRRLSAHKLPPKQPRG